MNEYSLAKVQSAIFRLPRNELVREKNTIIYLFLCVLFRNFVSEITNNIRYGKV